MPIFAIPADATPEQADAIREHAAAAGDGSATWAEPDPEPEPEAG